MKRFVLVLTSLLMIFSVAACGGEKYGYYDYDLTKYVETGEFKGIKISASDIAVTDEETETALKGIIKDSGRFVTAEVKKGRPVQNGDIVNIDYKGMRDGVAFEGGSAEGAELEIGSGRFIPGFEEGLIAVGIGAKKSLNLTFPDPYPSNPDLAGKPVVFEVKVNSAKTYVCPEITDRLAEEISGFKTVAEFKENIRQNISDDKKRDVIREKMVSSATVTKYPKKQIEAMEDELNANYRQYADNYGISLDRFVETYIGMDPAVYNQKVTESAQNEIKLQMLCVSIARRDGIELSDDEFREYVEYFTKSYGYENEEACIRDCGKSNITVWGLVNKVIQQAADNCTVE